MDENNRGTFSSIQLGLGIILILMAIGSFAGSVEPLNTFSILFYGAGSLLSGFAYKNASGSEKSKMLINVSSVCFLFGAAIMIYHSFFVEKQ